MAGKLVVLGFPQALLGNNGVTIMIDSVPVGLVSAKGRMEIPIYKNCILTCKAGKMSKDSIQIEDGMRMTIQLSYSRMWGTTSMEVINKEPYTSNQEDNAEHPVYVLDGGVGDILEVYEDWVVIRHTGVRNALAMGIKGDKTLYYSDITSVQFKKPGKLSGYIQFSLPGGCENTGGLLSATGDENTITVGGNATILAEQVVEYMNKRIRELKTKKSLPSTVVQQASSADELKKFKELLDMGIITQEEFDAKKKQLLGL